MSLNVGAKICRSKTMTFKCRIYFVFIIVASTFDISYQLPLYYSISLRFSAYSQHVGHEHHLRCHGMLLLFRGLYWKHRNGILHENGMARIAFFTPLCLKRIVVML
jgi:hypothetical protein